MFRRLIKLNSNKNFSRSSSSLSSERIETVLHLKLNRPDERNCLNREMIDTLRSELIKFQEDNNLKSVLLSGSGGNFCSGLNVNEITNANTLRSLSDLFQMFPLNKPSIVAVEGYALCAGLQLALACDYKIVETDSRLQLNRAEHLPFHPYIKQLYAQDLEILFQNVTNQTDLKHLCDQHLITKCCQIGCCFGVAFELGKCIEKFSIESIIYDRKKLYESNESSVTPTISSKKDDLIAILNDENLYRRSSRFIQNHIGRHGATNTDTLDEIYLRWAPELIQRNEL